MKNCSDKIIYHIFRADVPFLTTTMIENIINDSKMSHYFIIVGVTDNNKINFIELFKKYNYDNYIFINEVSDYFKIKLITKVLKILFKISFFNWEIELLSFISKLKHPKILIHAECSVMFGLLLAYKSKINKNLVIWGSVVKPSNKSFLYLKLRKKIYSSFLNIVCLMPEDCERFITYYNYKNSIFIPYSINLSLIVKNLQIKKDNLNLKILLGNSGNCISNYYYDLKVLEKFKYENINIDCMLNYGSSEIENNKLIKLGTSIYDSKFKAHTLLWSKEYYYNFMTKFDIYISSRLTQSGLGAIYLALLLGMKVFLAGNNFNYFKNMGINIYHTDQLNNINYVELCSPLSKIEKEINISIIEKLLDYDNVSEKWEGFYDKINCDA